jgi:hypothetical protein
MLLRPAFVRRRPLLRAAVVGGGAYMAGRSVARRQDAAAAQEAGQDARISELEQQPAASQMPAASQRPAQPAGSPQLTQAAIPQQSGQSESPMLDQLSQLTALHQQGALTDAEFAAAKAKLLGT